MATLYPNIEPFDAGVLDVGAGHQVYWETCGNPRGKPAVVLHGGPGSGCTPRHRRYFDPEKYRIVLFDQRGSGRSTPHASDPNVDLSTNTTQHLIDDMERLRKSLGVEAWTVWGYSWGVTLGLAYAEQYPERVCDMVLGSVTMTRRADVHWLYHEVRRFLPSQWESFRGGVPVEERDGDLVAAYHALLNESSDIAVREKAAKEWCAWEDAVVSLEDGWSPNPRYDDPAFRMAFARIVSHYFHHGAWLEEGQILRDTPRLAAIPGVLVHGQLDLGAPLDTAWQLARAWTGSELVVVPTGHGGGPDMTSRLVEATDRFALSR